MEASTTAQDGPPALWMTLNAVQRREIGTFGWLVEGNGIRDCAIRTYLVRVENPCVPRRPWFKTHIAVNPTRG